MQAATRSDSDIENASTVDMCQAGGKPGPDNERRGLFSEFARVANEAGGTTKRLEKASILAAYFDSLNDADLALAARYLTGSVFPLRDQRTTNVGGSLLLNVLADLTHYEPATIRQALVTHGDFGDAVYDLLISNPPATTGEDEPVALRDIEVLFDRISVTASAKDKRKLLEEILRRTEPLEARFIIKLLSGELRIGLQEGAVEDAIARWSRNEVGAVQWANMLTGDTGETALLARSGQLDSAQMRLFHPLKFMLATAAPDLESVARQMPAEFIVEDKYDGIRAQAHVARRRPGDDTLHGKVAGDIRVALFTRTLDEITHSYPDLALELAQLCPVTGGVILDGEIIGMKAGTILPFQDLQLRLGKKEPDAALIKAVPLVFVVYDILFAGDEVLLSQPFSERRQKLEQLVTGAEGVIAAPSRTFTDSAELDAEFDAARARGNEGLMVKDPASPYRPGRRGREWLKIKRALASLDVVVTTVEVGNGRRKNLLSDYTFAVRASADDPTLLNIGKAYSGLTDKELTELSEWFRAHTLQEYAHGKVRLVEPKVVIEVTFDRVQASARHKSGFALRFPRILRIRDDKLPGDIDTLATVAGLAGASTEE